MSHAQDVAKASRVDPMTSFINQLNPFMMAANSKYNVEVGNLNGYSRHDLNRANTLSVLKPVMQIGGTALVAAGAILSAPTGGLSGILIAGGAALLTYANTMDVNTQTGQVRQRMSDRAAINSAAAIGSAFGPGWAIASSIGGATLNSGLEFDENGNSGGWNTSGHRGDALAVNVAMAAGSGALWGAAVCGSM